jgi:hypothetical protein
MTDRSCSRRNEVFVRNLLLAAIAGGSAATGVAACESTIVDGEGGGGASSKGVTVGAYKPEMGNGTGTSTAGTGNAGGGGGGAPAGPWCTAVDTSELDEPDLVYVCSNTLGSPCPSFDSNLVFQTANTLINEPSGCGLQVSDVVCGPDPGAEHCCYVAQVGYNICEGRPFTGLTGSVIASEAAREDWLRACPLAAVDIGPAARRALGDAWAESALAEHASVASFARLVLELLALGAPADLVAAAQRALGDEIEHASLAFGIASALREAPCGPGPLDIGAALGRGVDPVAIAEATVLEGCVNETVSACLALAERDAATVPEVRAALERIAADEVEHAALSWRIVTWLVRRHGEPVRAAVRAAFDRARPEVSVASLARVEPSVARSWGRLPQDEAAAVIRRAFDEAVRPAAAALLAGFDDRARASA